METLPHESKQKKEAGWSDGVKFIPINIDFVKPEYKSEVPDYRTERDVMKLGADAWGNDSVKQAEIETEVLESDSENDTKNLPELTEETTEPEVIEVTAKIETEAEIENIKEPRIEHEESSTVEEVFVDDEQVDRIITRMRENAANINRIPNHRSGFKLIEGGLSGSGPRKFENIKTTGLGIEVNEISLEALGVIKERLKELEKEFNAQGLNDIQLYASTKARDEVLKRVIELEDIYNSEEPVTIEGQIDAVRSLNKSIEVYGSIRNEIDLEINKKENTAEEEHGSEPLVLISEKKFNKGSQEESESISSANSPEPLRRFLKIATEITSKPKTVMAEEEEKSENHDFSEPEKEVDSEEPVSEVFVSTDESELPFDDLPNITKEGLANTKAIKEREEFINEAAEIASAAENLMLKELRNKGMQAEWSEGKYFGVARALSEMRVDDFLRTKDAHDKSRLWLADLQQRAGGFAPRLERNLTLAEYVPMLYQGIIKAQWHAEKNGRVITRTKLLGI